MKPSRIHIWLIIVAGVVYGTVLGFLSAVCVGIGHGPAIPAVVTSSPLIIFGFPAALLGGPIVWGWMAWLLSRLAYKTRIVFLVAMAIRYAVAIGFICWSEYYDATPSFAIGDPEKYALAAWTIIFGAGEAFLWCWYFINHLRGISVPGCLKE